MRKYFSLLLSLLLVVGTAAARSHRSQVTFTTTYGKIVVELYDDTPIHRDNFLHNVRIGAYDGVLFHRIIEDFMVQGGDPLTRPVEADDKVRKRLVDGADSVNWLPAEIRLPQHFHKRGALAAAREGDEVNPERKSSHYQFYIVWGTTYTAEQLDQLEKRMQQIYHTTATIAPEQREYYQQHAGTPHLDGYYTVFGEVVEGLDLIASMQAVATDASDRPIADIRILRAEVTRR